MNNNLKEGLEMNYSPLRYPGGKSKITPFVKLVIEKLNMPKVVYVEPFAGGAGVALSLLFNNVVDEIVINDYDKAIYSMWKAILEETDSFIELIRNTPLTIDEWDKQKRIYFTDNKRYSLELGFATFYLNRTNRSGILKAGPIGGRKQTGNYLLDARFNKKALIDKIRSISKFNNKIHLYNKDIRSFIKNYLPKYEERAFVYFDPPYFNKGKELYTNFFNENDHKEISKLIADLNCPWMVTYDDVNEIQSLYSNYTCKRFDLTYSVANSGKKSEIMFLSDDRIWPTEKELKTNNITINVRNRV